MLNKRVKRIRGEGIRIDRAYVRSTEFFNENKRHVARGEINVRRGEAKAIGYSRNQFTLEEFAPKDLPRDEGRGGLLLEAAEKFPLGTDFLEDFNWADRNEANEEKSNTIERTAFYSSRGIASPPTSRASD